VRGCDSVAVNIPVALHPIYGSLESETPYLVGTEQWCAHSLQVLDLGLDSLSLAQAIFAPAQRIVFCQIVMKDGVKQYT